MNADEFLDAPSADEFLGVDAPAAPRKKITLGRGNAPTKPPQRFESVLQQPGNAEAFAAAPDPRANAEALFNALKTNPDLVKSPMYQAGAAVLERQATGEPSAVQSTLRRNDRNRRLRAQKDRQVIAARESTDEAYGGPAGQALAAPGRRLLSGAAQVVGGVASIPQLFGSDVGRETAEAANLMARANMPEDPGIADEVLAGAGQILPMVGGATALRAALVPLFGEAAATGIATTASGAAGGAMSGGEVLRDLEGRTDLSEGDKQRRAGLSALFSAVTGKYADRLLIPGADRAASGVLSAGGRAFAGEGGQEMLDQMGQNLATDRNIGEGALRAGLVGGIVGGGTRVASEVGSDANQLARAIDADALALAEQPPVRFAPEALAARPLPAPVPAPAPVAAAPALPYDPSVKASPDIMVAGQDGTVRPMTADEFLQAEDTRQDGIDTGLTPDVRRAQQSRSDVTDVEPKPSQDLLDRLVASGWTPPNKGDPRGTSEEAQATPAAAADPVAAPRSQAPAGDARAPGADGANRQDAGEPDAALTDGIAGDLEGLYQRDVKDGIRERLGLSKPDERADAAKRYSESPLIRGIAGAGGIELSQRSDMGVDPKRQTSTGRIMPQPFNINRRPLFRGDGLRGDALVEHLVQTGYLSQSEVDEAEANGVGSSEQLAYDLVRQELEDPGSVGPASERTGRAQDEGRGRMAADLHRQARLIGFDTNGMDEPQIAAALKRIERRREQATARKQQFDQHREAQRERQAAQDHEDFTSAQLDALDVQWLEDSNVSERDAMMALGFDPEEIDAYEAREAEDRAGGQAPDGPARGRAPRAGAADEGSEGRPALESYSPDEVVGRQERAAQAGRDEQRQQREDDQRAEADHQRDGFTLTGSDRAADANQDQDDLQFSEDYDGPTMAEINALSSVPTVDVVREAIEAVGAQEFERQAQERIREMTRNGKFKEPGESMLIEATARRIVALERRKAGDQFRRGPERASNTSTATSLRTELRARFGDVIDRLERRGFLKLWDTVQDYNASGQFSQLPPDASGAAQGMYSHKTGVAHLFGDGIEPGQAVAVMLHEVGEHASMKAMLGEARYKDLVRRAHRLAADGDEIAETAMMRIPDDTPAKFFDSELVAYMIEETATREGKMSPAARSWLADALAALRAWFYQTGFAKQLERYGVKVDLSPKDIAALAVRAVRWQAEQGGQTRSQATGEPDIALSKRAPVSATGSNPQPVQNLGAQPWTVAEPGTWDNIVRTMQNSKVDLKRASESIEKRFGRIPDSKDAYLSEELYHGKVAARVEKLHQESVEPILRKIMVAGKDHGVTLDDVNRYLHARHAPERNAAMAAINPTMANNQALSGMSDADAAKVLADFQRAGKAPALAAIAKDVDQLLADTRTNLVADGLEEAGTVQAWEQAYKHYVPLMRDVDDAPAKGSGFSVRGPEAKRATGSNRQVVNILANVVTQAETAAIRAEKADVGRTLLQMAKAYPNADFWKVDTPPQKPRINPHTGLVERSAVDPLYQTADNVVMVKDYGATRFIVFNKDNARAVEVAKAMKNLEVQQVPKFIRYVGAATRFMASLLTQRNPEFWFTNLARDLQGSAIQMNGTEAEGLQAKVMGYLPKALAGMRHVARDTGKSTQWARYAQELKDAGGTTGYMQMFENSDERMKDLQKEVDRMGQGKADPRRLARQLLEFIDDYNEVIENGMRLAVFQAAREAGVSTARAASLAKNITVNFNRKGNATPFVNSLYMFFNAGIQGTARLSAALATSNKARAVVGGLAGVAFVMDIVNRAFAGDDDETGRNRYDLINEFEKSRNWIVMLPDGKYAKVPLPLGFHIFHNAGRLIGDAMHRKDPRNAAEYGWAFASTVLDAFNPVGSFASVGQLLGPSVADPVVQLTENKNFMGGKVYRDDDMGFGKTDPRPAYQRYFETTPDFWKAASKALNDITGGDKVKPGAVNIEPDVLRHVWGSLTGGPGRALDKSVDTVQAKARGEEITPARLPFAHRFLGEIGDRQQDAAYFEDLKRVAKAKDQFDYFVKAGRRQHALEVLKELGDGDVARGRQVIAKFDAVRKDERAINKRLRQLREQEGDNLAVTEQIKALKERRSAGRHRVLKNTGADEEE